MSVAILDRGLRLRRRSLVAWALGSAAFTAMVVAIFPVVRDDPTFDELLAEYPEPILALIGGDVGLTTGPGFLSAELYSLVLPVLVAVIAASTAAAVLAGEDERGWLALVLAGPDRDRLVFESAGIVAVVAAVPVIASAVVVLIADPLVDLKISLRALSAVSLATWVFGLVFGAVALLVGALVGRRSAAFAFGVGALLFAYGTEIVGSAAEWGRWLRELSPFHHLVGPQPAVHGLPMGALVVALAALLGAVELSARCFARRDLVR